MSVMVIDAHKMALILTLVPKKENTVREAMMDNYQAYKDRYNEKDTFENFEFMWKEVLRKKQITLTKNEFLDAVDTLKSLEYNTNDSQHVQELKNEFFNLMNKRLINAYGYDPLEIK